MITMKWFLDFPRGTQIGTLLHRYFEKVSFAQLAENENIEKLCQDLNLAEEQFVSSSTVVCTNTQHANFAKR